MIGQGRHADEPTVQAARLATSISCPGPSGQPGDAAISMGQRWRKESTFTAAIACAAVDVDGPLVEPMAECLGGRVDPSTKGLINFQAHVALLRNHHSSGMGRGRVGDSVVQDSCEPGNDHGS